MWHSKYLNILCLKKLLVNILCFFSYEVMAPPGTLSTFNGFWLNHWELLTLCPRIYGSSLPSLLLSSLLLLSLPLYLSVSPSLSVSLWEICIFLRLHGDGESEKKTSYSNFPYFLFLKWVFITLILIIPTFQVRVCMHIWTVFS